MKKLIAAICVICAVSLMALDVRAGQSDIRQAARQASVMPILYHPVIRVSFTTPLEPIKKAEYKEDVVKDLIKDAIDNAIKSGLEKASENKYETRLTAIERYGVTVKSQIEIPIGLIAPKHAQYPTKILAVTKTKKEDVKAWDDESKKDVLAISEVAGISMSQASTVLQRLQTAGYSVTKETTDPTAEVKLFHFSTGWDDPYPTALDWKVRLEGSEENLIIGYDPRGILITRPIPLNAKNEISRVYISAGYYDLKTEYKTKSPEEQTLLSDKELLEKELERVRKELQDALKEKAKPDEKRDITQVTWFDVMYKRVKIEYFWMMSGGSGVFLGNMQVADKLEGLPWNQLHFLDNRSHGVILTNAHVVDGVLFDYLYVSEDKEVMWFFLPATLFVRYTQDSDQYGSPGKVLIMDGQAVFSNDVDTAIIVTSPIPEYEQYAAKLGDSDKISEGDRVIMVGNPMLLQKFLTEGVISNTNYNLLKTYLVEGTPMNRSEIAWLSNSCLWFDNPIGFGGTSGSGVWAMGGSQKGKVIGLHNMGMVTRQFSGNVGKSITIDPERYQISDKSILLKRAIAQIKDEIVRQHPLRNARFGVTMESFLKDNESFKEALKKSGYREMAGMNAAIPINRVKAYLQERGLAPTNFSWEGLKSKYWTR